MIVAIRKTEIDRRERCRLPLMNIPRCPTIHPDVFMTMSPEEIIASLIAACPFIPSDYWVHAYNLAMSTLSPTLTLYYKLHEGLFCMMAGQKKYLEAAANLAVAIYYRARAERCADIIPDVNHRTYMLVLWKELEHIICYMRTPMRAVQTPYGVFMSAPVFTFRGPSAFLVFLKKLREKGIYQDPLEVLQTAPAGCIVGTPVWTKSQVEVMVKQHDGALVRCVI